MPKSHVQVHRSPRHLVGRSFLCTLTRLGTVFSFGNLFASDLRAHILCTPKPLPSVHQEYRKAGICRVNKLHTQTPFHFVISSNLEAAVLSESCNTHSQALVHHDYCDR